MAELKKGGADQANHIGNQTEEAHRRSEIVSLTITPLCFSLDQKSAGLLLQGHSLPSQC